MEKISIARRRLEKKKAAVLVKSKPNDFPPGMNYLPPDAGCPIPGMVYPPTNTEYPPPGVESQSPGMVNPSPERGKGLPEPGYPAAEPGNIMQPPNAPGSESAPVYTLDSLISLISQEGGLLELGKKKFTLEIVSGVEKPIKMLVSIQPVNNANSPDKFEDNDKEKNYLTPEEAAQSLRVSKHTIYRQLKEGSLKGLKIGCRWRVILNPEGIVEGSERGNG